VIEAVINTNYRRLIGGRSIDISLGGIHAIVVGSDVDEVYHAISVLSLPSPFLEEPIPRSCDHPGDTGHPSPLYSLMGRGWSFALPRPQKATALAVDECGYGWDVVPLSPAVREAKRRN